MIKTGRRLLGGYGFGLDMAVLAFGTHFQHRLPAVRRIKN
jgi:hypothetical protein